VSVLLTLPTSGAAPLSIRAKALVFNDPRSEELLSLANHIAPTEATALIIGETGTGKELLARYLHTHSGRKGAFVAVNCGAFSETLIDAELFGHEAGAFTGATQARQGWFEAANGGTLFLDEIGDLPLSMQVKLLRVIQERQIVRLGSRRPTPLDVRLVAATNVDLFEAVRAGHFRADLYYRLGVATLELPPLCARTGDILPLAQHFVQHYAQRLQIAPATIADDARDVLLHYDWPGNIRELENTIHYALIVCRDGVLRAADLRLGHRPFGTHNIERMRAPALAPVHREAVPDTAAPEEAADDGRSLQDRLQATIEAMLDDGEEAAFDRIEAAVVGAALAIARNNQTQTARVLGISRNVLRTLLKRHRFFTDKGDEDAQQGVCIA
jgi:sigma-54 dependent transcriptional regulator